MPPGLCDAEQIKPDSVTSILDIMIDLKAVKSMSFHHSCYASPSRDCENDGCFEGDENAGWNEGAMMEVIGNDK